MSKYAHSISYQLFSFLNIRYTILKSYIKISMFHKGVYPYPSPCKKKSKYRD